jgi:hypothetical protein
MECQALRDAVVSYNTEGLAGLHDRAKGRPVHPQGDAQAQTRFKKRGSARR